MVGQPRLARIGEGTLDQAAGAPFLSARQGDFRQPFQSKYASGQGVGFDVQAFRQSQQAFGFVDVAGAAGDFPQDQTGQGLARHRSCRFGDAQELAGRLGDGGVSFGIAQAEFGQAQMAVENRRDELAAGAHPLDEFLAKQLAPAPLHVRGQAQNSACFTDLAAEAGFQSLCTRVTRQFGGLVKSAALQMNQGPGQ